LVSERCNFLPKFEGEDIGLIIRIHVHQI
jgi:hypothetical protein